MTDLAQKKCRPCEGGVEPLAAEEARDLLGSLQSEWQLDGQDWLVRAFDFSTFGRTIAFVNAVAWVATVEGHHPQLQVDYGRCEVRYRTNAINGLSVNDFICAAKIDRLFDNG